MTLYLIGIGLADEQDITVKGREAISSCQKVYLENYTSLLQCTKEDLEKFYGKKITLATREISEQGAENIVEEARHTNIAFLVIGDALSATTHIELFRLAKEKNIKVEIIHNASILTAVGITGLQLYKFGKTISIPFTFKVAGLESPYLIITENKERGLHTLCLLDIEAEQQKFMTIPEALEILENIEVKRKENVLHNSIIIGCARLGSKSALIKSGTLQQVKNFNFGAQPHSLIIPGELHFVEEEMLKVWF